MVSKVLIAFFISFNAQAQLLEGVRQDDFEANMREKKGIEDMQEQVKELELESKMKLQLLKSEQDKNEKYGKMQD
ncbi:MAG: hypothetical protein K2Q18_07470 [Bdellovibrionales bacterium]|nr:hypothetical protein [Bdellovibrionales bacterium]